MRSASLVVGLGMLLVGTTLVPTPVRVFLPGMAKAQSGYCISEPMSYDPAASQPGEGPKLERMRQHLSIGYPFVAEQSTPVGMEAPDLQAGARFLGL